MNLWGMNGWISHMYSNRPALLTVNVFVPENAPVLNELSVAVTVWSVESLLSTVMVSPTLTWRVSGAKAKFEMVIVLDPEADEPLSDPPHPAAMSRKRAGRVSMAARRRVLTSRCTGGAG